LSDQIIVRMDASGKTYINKQVVPIAEFPNRLTEALTGRAAKVIFFAADGELPYDQVADFMDLCRDAGAENLGIVFEDMRGAG
jgi:biopolymer transport protein TolR